MKVLTVGLIVTLALGLLAAPFLAGAQQPAKVPRVGILVSGLVSTHGALVDIGRQGLRDLGYVEGRVRETKHKLVSFLIEAKRAGKSLAGYGAPGKGNTMLNYCGIRRDFLDYTVDRNPYKQGKFTPGTRIPIHPPERIRETRPDYLLTLPWNLKDEIMKQMAYIREWGGQFVVPIPEVQVYP
jgi:hypothetical protein